MNLSSTIKSIQDIMRKDDGVDGDAQRIGQLSWMLFLKIFDQCEETWENDTKNSRKKYRSPLPEECRWRNWTKNFKEAKGEKTRAQGVGLIKHVNDAVFPGLQHLNIKGNSKAKVVHDVFQDANNYMKSGTQMLAVIEKLDQSVDFHNIKNRGQLGDVYEHILNDLRSAGNAGEFYTPRSITEFMVKMVNPSFKKREIVLDPACGTGGFLTATIAHLESQISKRPSAENYKTIAECISGFEKKKLPHLLCVTNMMLHGIEVPSMIEHRNTLATSWDAWKNIKPVSCVITNPPFGGMEESDVGNDYPSDVRTRETADMFLVLIVKRLLATDGGRGAVVLPDGTPFGEGVKARVKKLLMEECHLHTIIRLPNGVFSPYTGIKTNLLFFTRGKPTNTIWFYEHRYPAGVRSYSKTKPLRTEEFDPIVAWWGDESDGFTARSESEQAWKIDFEAIKQAAEAKAEPYWEAAKTLSNEASVLANQIKNLRDSLKTEKSVTKSTKTEEKITTITNKFESLRQQAREQQSIGDRHFWPIYNLDIKNPNVVADDDLDADDLLVKYKALEREIENTQIQLKRKLSIAMTHHLDVGKTAR